MKISVCIPAYNRAGLLVPLLNSISNQNYPSYEIVICEDCSPERKEIRAIVSQFEQNHAVDIRYFENSSNLGYDGNIRNLIAKSKGEYCFFMGNDDLMYSDALSTVASVIARYDNIGVMLRTYASFDQSSENINQVFRYFKQETFFPAGVGTITTFYRRSVVISGLVIRCDEALKYSTDQFDGTLLYQLYLVANILTKLNGVFSPQILALYRNGGIPDFGNSEKEKGGFVPNVQTPDSSLHFMKGMLDIVRWTQTVRGINIYQPIMKDIGNYCYPILSIQAKQPIGVFLKYSYRFALMGFWKNKMFYVFFLALLLMGEQRSDRMIQYIKDRWGYTPTIGNVYGGRVR